jgi:hypothetical protein
MAQRERSEVDPATSSLARVLESRGWKKVSEFKHGSESQAWFEKDGQTRTGYSALQQEWKTWHLKGDRNGSDD